ncbi:hypothetical protein QUF51_03565 [Bacillus pumilus]|nr:hypothetical protein [Bacillus pumilus]
MNSNIQELIEKTRMKFGLDHYHLKRQGYSRYVNMFNETIYRFSMEWFPPHQAEPEDDDSNPEGTAVIEVNLNTGQYEMVIFVMGKTFAKDGVKFDSHNPNDIIHWVEQETGLTYKEHFQLQKAEDGELFFDEKMDGYPVTPSGTIEVNWDQDGKLVYFVHHGPFLAKKLMRNEEYALCVERIEDIAKQQVQRLEWPSFEQNRIRSVYALEEIYVKNDGTGNIPFEWGHEETHCIKMNQVMEWDESLNDSFEKKELNIHEDISAEQAFSFEPSPDTMPISREEQDECIEAVRTFLRQEYPKDTGKWVLNTLHRHQGYIHAILKASYQEDSGFKDKIKVFIDANSFKAVNYIDKKEMFQVCGILDPFQAASGITISKKEAFEKLRDYFELTPIYVYDLVQKQYVLCGKLDCHYGVDAASGEVILLQDI